MKVLSNQAMPSYTLKRGSFSELLFRPHIHTSGHVHISDMRRVRGCKRLGPVIHVCRFWGRVSRGFVCFDRGFINRSKDDSSQRSASGWNTN